MRRILFTNFILLIALFLISSCSSNKTITKKNNTPPPNKSNTQLVATANNSETELNETDNAKINSLAGSMATLYCEIVQLNRNYTNSGNEAILAQIKEKEQKLSDLESDANRLFTTDLQKNELSRVYNDLIKKCK